MGFTDCGGQEVVVSAHSIPGVQSLTVNVKCEPGMTCCPIAIEHRTAHRPVAALWRPRTAVLIMEQT